MKFLDLAQKRFSVRDYLPAPVTRQQLETVLEAGRLAPSACNNQPWCFIVLQGPEPISRLENVYARPWFLKAPAVIAVCCDTVRAWQRADGMNSGAIDAAIALDHMTLAATEAGLGTCWICNFNVLEAKKVLELPDHIEPIALTPLGTPGPGAVYKKSRKALDEIIFFERFGAKRADYFAPHP
jgi:nitroreductase